MPRKGNLVLKFFPSFQNPDCVVQLKIVFFQKKKKFNIENPMLKENKFWQNMSQFNICKEADLIYHLEAPYLEELQFQLSNTEQHFLSCIPHLQWPVAEVHSLKSHSWYRWMEGKHSDINPPVRAN